MEKLLNGKLFISTKSSGRSSELQDLFEEQGAQLLSMPTIKIVPYPINKKIKRALNKIDTFDWIIFTSSNGVKCFFDLLFEYRENHSLPEHLKIAVIGKKTAAQLERYGTSATFINLGNTSEEFIYDFISHVKLGENILFPAGSLARNTIARKLTRIAKCKRINVYETVFPDTINQDALQHILNNQYEMIILTSPSSFENLLQITHKNIQPNQLKLACIGTTTANAVTNHGLKPLVTAKMSGSQGILNSILNYYQKN